MAPLIDTHVHTNLSDGLESPATVLELAAAGGIELLSITDHDCVRAYPDAITAGDRLGIRVIPGVEITTRDEPGFCCVHVVGLGVRTGPGVSALLDRVVAAREEANIGFLENMNAYMARKYPRWQPVESTKPSIFYNAMQSAAACGIRLSEKELMDVLLDQELWTPLAFELTLEEAISYIKQWGGVPVLAHPFDFSNDAGLVLRRFVAAGGEAVELCKYRYKVRSSALHMIGPEELLSREREMNLWTMAQARKNRLRLTMASDHHDARRPMGSDPAEYGIDVAWLVDLSRD